MATDAMALYTTDSPGSSVETVDERLIAVLEKELQYVAAAVDVVELDVQLHTTLAKFAGTLSLNTTLVALVVVLVFVTVMV